MVTLSIKSRQKLLLISNIMPHKLLFKKTFHIKIALLCCLRIRSYEKHGTQKRFRVNTGYNLDKHGDNEDKASVKCYKNGGAVQCPRGWTMHVGARQSAHTCAGNRCSIYLLFKSRVANSHRL